MRAPLETKEDAALTGFCAASILILAACVFLLSARAADRSGGLQQVKPKLKWQHQFQFAGYYAAQAHGYYREEGLDVSIIEGDAKHPPIEQVLAGGADFGV